MLAYYALVKTVHISAVAASGLVFLLRGLLVQSGRTGVAMAAPVRYASYAIDTVLLTAALMLFTMLPAVVFANHWLAVKLMLLVLYVLLGTYALKRAATSRARAVCFAGALGVYVLIIGIALAHHPLGWLASRSA
jgi:uncharacterized membrane protein SirB2